MRPGRLDRILYVSPPDLESRKKIFSVNFSKMAIAPEVLVDELAIIVRLFPSAIVFGGWWVGMGGEDADAVVGA